MSDGDGSEAGSAAGAAAGSASGAAAGSAADAAAGSAAEAAAGSVADAAAKPEVGAAVGPEAGSAAGPAGASGASGLGDAARPGTGEVTATVIVNAPAATVFAAFTAWQRQGEWIPFTQVRVVEGDGGEGSSIEAVTRIGPAVLRDQMRVLKMDPPRTVRVVHYGKVLRGPGVLRCTPMEGGRTQVVWHEWFHLPGGTAGRVAWPVMWPGSKAGLTAALRRFARLVEAGRLP